MRYRPASEADIAGIVATLGGRNAVPLEPRVRAAFPALLRQLIASPACTVTVFEVADARGTRILSFASGLFVRDAVAQQYLASPRPGWISSLLADLLDDRRPLLTLDEIRTANAAGGLTLVVFPVSYGQLAWDDALFVELRKLAPHAFMHLYAGYRLRAIYYEVFTDEAAEYLRVGGYRLLHDFSAHAGSGFFAPDCRPRMLRLTLAELPPGAMSMATQMFDPPAARLGLTPSEQRVALRALDGSSDRAIATALGLSPETVRSSWRSMYARLAGHLPGLERPSRRGGEDTRGLEKRRLAIEYLRQNMHELRPLPVATRGARPGAAPRGGRLP
jgi:DNA-binding CsgD family transcriptional regulator